jgi:UDP-N-acetylglucosamine 4,6-dehydratase
MFKNKTILITGGTGSFGKAFVAMLLEKFKTIKKIIIFSRDELKQFEMARIYEKHRSFKKLRFFIGDIRDKDRLDTAFNEVDIVIHAAALKQVPTSEYNPFETIKTNIIGTQNVVESCLKNNVKKLISLSTDKASSPINLYGATKLCSDKLTVSAEYIKGNNKLIASVVRYGNVLGSRGSIIPILIKQKDRKTIQLTNPSMTRFNILLSEAVNFVLESLKNSKGGEIFVPKLPSYKLIDLAKVICPKSKFIFTGIRPGEKIHEEMISLSESMSTVEYKNYYVILPSFKNYTVKKYVRVNGGKISKKAFDYNSGTNNIFLKKNEIKKIISDFVR